MTLLQRVCEEGSYPKTAPFQPCKQWVLEITRKDGLTELGHYWKSKEVSPNVCCSSLGQQTDGQITQTAAVCPGMTGEAQVSQGNSSERGAGIPSVHASSSSYNQHFDNSPYNDLAAFFMALSPSTGLPTVTG